MAAHAHNKNNTGDPISDTMSLVVASALKATAPKVEAKSEHSTTVSEAAATTSSTTDKATNGLPEMIEHALRQYEPTMLPQDLVEALAELVHRLHRLPLRCTVTVVVRLENLQLKWLEQRGITWVKEDKGTRGVRWRYLTGPDENKTLDLRQVIEVLYKQRGSLHTIILDGFSVWESSNNLITTSNAVARVP